MRVVAHALPVVNRGRKARPPAAEIVVCKQLENRLFWRPPARSVTSGT